MKNCARYPYFACMIVMLLLLLMVLPVSGVAIVSGSPTPATPAVSQKAVVTANASAATITIGDPVTISGTVTGSTVSEDVQIWVFAGNYVNVSTVPLRADGTFSKAYGTAGFPPATYYVFVQAPGDDGVFDLDLAQTGVYSGQVVTAGTGALLFNFTGSGSVHDAAALAALADALNEGGRDDVYTKTTFRLAEPAALPAETPMEQATTGNLPPAPTRSSLSPLAAIVATGITGVACTAASRRQK